MVFDDKCGFAVHDPLKLRKALDAFNSEYDEDDEGIMGLIDNSNVTIACILKDDDERLSSHISRSHYHEDYYGCVCKINAYEFFNLDDEDFDRIRKIYFFINDYFDPRQALMISILKNAFENMGVNVSSEDFEYLPAFDNSEGYYKALSMLCEKAFGGKIPHHTSSRKTDACSNGEISW